MDPYFEKKAKKNDFAIFTYHKDFILTDKPDNKYVIQEANLNKMQIVGVDNFAEAVDFPPCKCMLASDDEEALMVWRIIGKNASTVCWMHSGRNLIS